VRPWLHGQPIRQLLQANLRLTLIEYPVAASALNPQERVWKLTRRAASHNHTISRPPDFADQFYQHLAGNTFHRSFPARPGASWLFPCFSVFELIAQ
jgi:hypothetical protein